MPERLRGQAPFLVEARKIVMGRSRVWLEAKGPLVSFNRFPHSLQILQRHAEIERRQGRLGIRGESLTVMDLGRFDFARLVE